MGGGSLLTIVSGGQTGADRAALEWAVAHAVPHRGWCPAGRWAEDGPIDPGFALLEAPSPDPAVRTRLNVRDSDGTVILSLAPGLAGGSAETLAAAEALGRPVVHLCARATVSPGGAVAEAAAALRRFVEDRRVRVLNVAGPRASEEPGISEFVRDVLDEAFGTA